jgi:glycosyltransferase involved in cell wall biosynthesis
VKITHLNTYDVLGGAAKAAYRLHTSLRLLGLDSRMVVADKVSTDPSVVNFQPSLAVGTRVRRVLRRKYIEPTQRLLNRRPRSAGYFTDDRSQYGSDVLDAALPADVLHLHWIARLIDYSAFFSALPANLPSIWTLHDMNPMTGGCHHASGCANFKNRCGDCPELDERGPNDLSAAVWQRKNRSYGRLDSRLIRIVTPSRWLANHARSSSLMKRFRVETIPYGLDTNTFQPRDRADARRLLGIPANAKVVLFVSQWLDDPYKGMRTLLEAVERLRSIPDLCLLVLGKGEAFQKGGVRSIFLGSVDDEERLSFAYSAADLFLLPSSEDNFPNTALESLACGIPVIGSNVGGIPEIVRDGYTGSLVEKGDAEGFAKAAEALLREGGLRTQMSENCRRVAVQEYALRVQSTRYVELYKDLLEEAGWKASKREESSAVRTSVGAVV